MRLLLLCFTIALSSSLMAHPHLRDSIQLDYTFDKTGQSANVIKVNATITNNSSRWFYFLSESCNGLANNITTTSTKATKYIIVNCNMSTPVKQSIAPKGTYNFTCRITYVGSLEKVGLNLSLIRVSKSYIVNEKLISKEEQQKKMSPFLLSGPVKTIPK